MGGRSLQEKLAEVHSQVAQGRARVEAHIEQIGRLKADGHDTQASDTLLSTLLNALEGVTQHRDELEKQAQTAPTFSVSHYQLALAS